MADPLSLNNMAQALPVVSPIVRAPALPPLAVMFGLPHLLPHHHLSQIFLFLLLFSLPMHRYSTCFSKVRYLLYFLKERVRQLEHELEFQKHKNEEAVALLNEQSVAAGLTISSMIASKEDFHFIVDVSSAEYQELKLKAETTAAKYVFYYNIKT